jgi:hypothetical protein
MMKIESTTISLSEMNLNTISAPLFTQRTLSEEALKRYAEQLDNLNRHSLKIA